MHPLTTLSHSGKQHSYHVALALKDLGALTKFYTSAYVASPQLQAYVDRTGNRYFSRRYLTGLHHPHVDANWRFELREVVLRRLTGKSKQVQEAVYDRDVAFDKYVAKRLRREPSNLFWGFQGSCHASLVSARGAGRITVCELATAHVTAAKRILGEEARLHPEWADSIDNLSFPSAYERRLEEEPHRADWCVAASDFTRRSLIEVGVPDERIVTLPLGFDASGIPYDQATLAHRRRGPLKVLYAGTVTQRKGIKYLLEAIKGLPSGEFDLHLIGGVQGSGRALASYAGHYTHHQPLPQRELFQRYADYDVLVLPTLFEGFGLVIVEAMAAGLPVITTPHSTGEALIRNGENGYLVPIRNVVALQATLQALRTTQAEGDYSRLRLAARSAAKDFNWRQYQSRLSRVLPKFMEG
ncbi:MAG: glycosyltransferase family 4 protein [Catalinimonas sp.]